MPQDVWRHGLGGKRWAASLGGMRVFGDQQGDGVAAERSASDAWEQRVVWPWVSLGESGPQDAACLFGERRDPLLAALAVTAQVRAAGQAHVIAGQGGELGDS